MTYQQYMARIASDISLIRHVREEFERDSAKWHHEAQSFPSTTITKGDTRSSDKEIYEQPDK